MTHASRRAWAGGLAVIGAYVALAALSGHLSLFARRPLLDGVAPPPPYRWVDPPPGLEQSNEKPLSETVTLALTEGGNSAGVVTTPDAQATIVLIQGAIAASPSQDQVTVSIKPLAPSGFGDPSDGYTITGNVYEIAGTYEPSGDPVTELTMPSNLILVYPASPNPKRHEVLRTTDGKAWTKLGSRDAPITQQINAKTTVLGDFAVAAASTAQPESGGTAPFIWIGLGAAAFVALVALVYGLSQGSSRQAKRETQRRARDRKESQRAAQERARRRAEQARRKRKR